MNENGNILRWLNGVPYEVSFWRSYYGSTKRRRDLFSWSLYNKECVVDNFDVQNFIASLPVDEPVAVDLGCALSYTFGNLFPGKPGTKVEYVDPLALFYNRILDDYRIDRPRIRFGMIENLSATYRPDSLSLVHVRNALDHCADPMRGIVEALACLHKGGVLYLNHFRNEARREAYRGFHQWNLDIDERGHLKLWNESGLVDVTERLAAVATVETSITVENRVVAVVTKTAELPPELFDPAESARNASEMLAATVGYFHSLPNTMRYQSSRLFTTMGHRVMRMLPFGLLNRIKKALGKD